METHDVSEVAHFIDMSVNEIAGYHKKNGFAMSVEDLVFVRDYFKKEGRNPTETEVKVIDTYWSDHCRHTTFSTEIQKVDIDSDNPHIQKAYDLYKDLFAEFNAKREDKYPCLMDIATIAVKKLKKEGRLDNLDVSDEINACSVCIDAKIDGKTEKYLVMFKNETHNHPTEIEPFGGAATCLGGAIRDPLSGRTYVYQAMRVTGSADPREKLADTLPGKLPQRVITKTAAAGFSSYGNQIGLATGMVDEVYHPGYKAKRLETGFVVGGAKRDMVYREKPKKGDVIILLGGETGRDGCGGATGSSKAHDSHSVETCGAEVQKGNPLTERKLQRLFLNKEVTRKIKKCNDFGAGGVSVAIGELADGLIIDLDKVPLKYEGLSGTELAISESQERMAVVVAEQDKDEFIRLAAEENLAATPVAVVTDDRRMKMLFKGRAIVDISRDFLDHFCGNCGQRDPLFRHRAQELPRRFPRCAFRPQRLLQEGAFGDVRFDHRRAQRVYALRRKNAAHARYLDGGEDLRRRNGCRYRIRLRLLQRADEQQSVHGRDLQHRNVGRKAHCERLRLRCDPPHFPGVFHAPEPRSQTVGRSAVRAFGRAVCADRFGPRSHRRQGQHERHLRAHRRSAHAHLLRARARQGEQTHHQRFGKERYQAVLDSPISGNWRICTAKSTGMSRAGTSASRRSSKTAASRRRSPNPASAICSVSASRATATACSPSTTARYLFRWKTPTS